MDAAMRDKLFGTGRPDLRHVFTPAGMSSTDGPGSMLATFKGFGRNGAGREQGLDLLRRFGVVAADQGAAADPVLDAVTGSALPAPARTGIAAVADADAGLVRYANPIYNSPAGFAIRQETGFVPLIAADARPAVAPVVDDAARAAAPALEAIESAVPAALRAVTSSAAPAAVTAAATTVAETAARATAPSLASAVDDVLGLLARIR